MHSSHSHPQEKVAEVLAPAKINLSLHVGPLQPDGFHPVCSLMDRITLADRVSAQRGPTGGGIRLAVSNMAGPVRENLAYRSAEALLREAAGPAGPSGQDSGNGFDVDIELIKQIPVAAGLGGGSSDAAAVLRLLSFLFRLDVPEERLVEIAAGLGADVPFFLSDGPQLAEGRGGLLTPTPIGCDYTIVLVNPGLPLSTAEVYRRFDETAGASGDDFSQRSRQLRESVAGLGSLEDLAALMHNDLAAPARSLCPQIRQIELDLAATGPAGVLVSGSGPSVFALYPDRPAAENAAAELSRAYAHLRVASPIPQGR